jgi:predicted DNA-binding protein
MQMTIRLPEDDKKRIDALVRKTGLKQSDIA